MAMFVDDLEYRVGQSATLARRPDVSQIVRRPPRYVLR